MVAIAGPVLTELRSRSSWPSPGPVAPVCCSRWSSTRSSRSTSASTSTTSPPRWSCCCASSCPSRRRRPSRLGPRVRRRLRGRSPSSSPRMVVTASLASSGASRPSSIVEAARLRRLGPGRGVAHRADGSRRSRPGPPADAAARRGGLGARGGRRRQRAHPLPRGQDRGGVQHVRQPRHRRRGHQPPGRAAHRAPERGPGRPARGRRVRGRRPRRLRDEGYLLPRRNLLDYLARHPGVSVVVRDGDGERTLDSSDGVRLPLVVRKLFTFRAVDAKDPPRCQALWLPAL